MEWPITEERRLPLRRGRRNETERGARQSNMEKEARRVRPHRLDRDAHDHGAYAEAHSEVLPGTLMDMLSMINMAQQSGDWRTRERVEKLLMDMLSMIKTAQQSGDWRTRERVEKLQLLLPRCVLRAPPLPEPQ